MGISSYSGGPIWVDVVLGEGSETPSHRVLGILPPLDVPLLVEPPEGEPVFEYDGADWFVLPEYEPPTFG